MSTTHTEEEWCKRKLEKLNSTEPEYWSHLLWWDLCDDLAFLLEETGSIPEKARFVIAMRLRRKVDLESTAQAYRDDGYDYR